MLHAKKVHISFQKKSKIFMQNNINKNLRHL